MRESKECEHCGGLYFRAEKVTQAMWAARRYCSAVCSGQALAKRVRVAIEEGKVGRLAKEERYPNTEPAERLDLSDQTLIAAPPAPAREPVMRELRIVRVGPNPRLVVCEYFELAERRLCTVLVKRTDKFVRGMRFKMAEPVDEAAYRRPWVYQGPAPRHRGRW